MIIRRFSCLYECKEDRQYQKKTAAEKARLLLVCFSVSSSFSVFFSKHVSTTFSLWWNKEVLYWRLEISVETLWVVFCIFVSCLLFVFVPCSLIGECVFFVVYHLFFSSNHLLFFHKNKNIWNKIDCQWSETRSKHRRWKESI